MLEITILEGARGTGKSTLASKLRQLISETTLINPTGFHLDGEDGLDKVVDYYENWISFLHNMSQHDSSIIFDRFYFSEEIYSRLYKDYSFSLNYKNFNNHLEALSQNVKINIFFLTIKDLKELENRLIRDKVPFGKAEESVKETILQQNLYELLFDSLNDSLDSKNIKIHTIDTSGKTTDEIYNTILQLKTT